MTSRSAAELAGKLHRAADLLAADRKAAEQVALFAKGEFVKGGVAAGLRPGGSLPSSGTSRWGASYEAHRITASAGGNAFLVRYRGPVHWAFGGTKAHYVGAKGRFRSRKALRDLGSARREGGVFAGFGRGALQGTGRGAKALKLPGNRFAAYAWVKGTTGRPAAWQATKKRVQVGAPRVYAPSVRRSLLSAGLGR